MKYVYTIHEWKVNYEREMGCGSGRRRVDIGTGSARSDWKKGRKEGGKHRELVCFTRDWEKVADAAD
jgi:hypothetical protein